MTSFVIMEIIIFTLSCVVLQKSKEMSILLVFLDIQNFY